VINLLFNFGKEEWIFLNQIAAKTNNFIAGNILFKNQKFSAHFHHSQSEMWKRKHFEERSWKLKQFWSIWLFEEAEAFFIKHGAGMWKRNLEAEAGSGRSG